MPEPAAPTGVLRHVEHVMGTVFSFVLRGEHLTDAALGEALAAALAWLHRVDATFSPYRPDSDISRLGRGERSLARCAPEVVEVLDACAEVHRATGGYFSLAPAGRLDPCALVKGWAIERAGQLLRAAGVADFSINGGGDIQLAGRPAPGRPWRVGIAHPLRPGTLATIVTGEDLAIATSGTAERGAHILNPHTGRPATALASLTLIGRHLSLVDAYATAAFAMGEDARAWIEDQPGLQAYAVTGHTWWTSGFPAYGQVPSPAVGPGSAEAVASRRRERCSCSKPGPRRDGQGGSGPCHRQSTTVVCADLLVGGSSQSRSRRTTETPKGGGG